MPELPEVEALALDLKGRLADRAIAKVHVVAFSALKTFDPPLQALEGTLVEDVTRHGKFLDISTSGLHLILHLARGGWVRWRDDVPPVPPRPNQKSGLAVRVILDDESGMDVTEMGTKKRLAIYVVRDPLDVPGIASLGPDPLDDAFTIDGSPRSSRRPAAPRSRACCATRAPSPASATPTPTSCCTPPRCRRSSRRSSLSDAELQTLYDAIRNVLGDAVERSRGLAASELKGEKKSHLAVHGRTGETCPVCGDTVREVSFADSSLQYCPTCQTGGKPLADRRLSRLLK